LNYTRTVVSIQLEDNNIHIVSLSTALRKIYKNLCIALLHLHFNTLIL